jgi:hypothetical protein
MSRRRNNQHTCSSGHVNRRRHYNHDVKPDAARKNDVSIEELSHGIDMEAAGIGLAIADLFKAVTLAAVRLPNMEMYSDLISVVVDDDSITVSVTGLSCKGSNKHSGKTRAGRCHCCDDPGYEEDSYNPYKDDEEERVYDGD